MLNRLASLPMSTRVLKALPGKLDIKRHSPSCLYLFGIKCYTMACYLDYKVKKALKENSNAHAFVTNDCLDNVKKFDI